MEGGGADGFREYCDAPAMREFYALSSAVSRKTYQQRLLDAGIPQGKSFPVELERRAAKGQVRGYVLLHKHVPVAYGLCYVHGDTLTLDKMGFDPDYAYTNAGTVLTYFIIQRLFAAQQFRIFDFGSGHYEYKALFATNSVRCADVIFMRPTLLNLTTALSHSGLNTISELLKHLLEVFGLKARVRRLIHRRL